jgi:hypothetical protein
VSAFFSFSKIEASSPLSIVEFLSDIVGTIVPLVFLWRISLPPRERRLVHGAISASLLTALSGAVTCAFWFTGAHLGKDVQLIMDGVHHQKVQPLLQIHTYQYVRLRLNSSDSLVYHRMQPPRHCNLLVAQGASRKPTNPSSVQTQRPKRSHLQDCLTSAFLCPRFWIPEFGERL